MHISFEYFPPKTDQGMESLITTTNTLKQFEPEFFSVTYGAGGSAQNHTLTTVTLLQEQCGVKAAAHITCVGSSKQSIRDLLTAYKNNHITRLVVLRGDLPSGMMGFDPDFKHAYQLVEFIRQETGDYFFIEVAAYPEMHPETPDPQASIDHLKLKATLGANRAITQYFFNADSYFYLLDDCQKNNITMPVIPGIMPISNYTQLARFSTLCGAEIPKWLKLRLEKHQNDPAALSHIGNDFIANLCARLINGGAPGLHFYTLNKATNTVDILGRTINHS